MSSDLPLEVGYSTPMLFQCLFPYRKITKENEIEGIVERDKRVVHDRNLTITIFSPEGLPYGRYSRILMAYIFTEAYKRSCLVEVGKLTEEQARTIPLGDSLEDFLKALGISGGSKQRRLLSEQIERLSALSVDIESRWNATKAKYEDVRYIMFDEFMVQETKTASESSYGTGSLVKLSSQAYNELIQDRHPYDLNILKSLRKPRAIDVYFYLVMQVWHVNRSPADDRVISWPDLATRFSLKPTMNSKEMGKFRQEMRSVLEQIKPKWEGLDVEFDKRAGLIIRPSRHPVPPIVSSSRKKYTPEYRQEAARLVIDTGRTIAEVSRKLGVGSQSLGKWVAAERATEAGEPTGELTLDERAELTSLRRQVAELHKDNEFLRKAVAFFAAK